MIDSSGAISALLLAIVIWCQPALARGDADARDGSPGAHSYMHCTGVSPGDRACFFQDLYYDTKTGIFEFYTTPAHKDALGLSNVQQTQADAESESPWLQLGRHPWAQEKDKRNLFRLDAVTDRSLPAEQETCRVRQPLHIRSPHKASSFGHLLRDNYQGLVEMARKLGRAPETYTWVRWPSSSPDIRGLESPTHVMEKYTVWLTRGGSKSWSEVVDGCKSQAGQSLRYIRFDDLLAGWGGVDMVVANGNRASSEIGSPVCTRERYTHLRDTAYGLHDLQHVPATNHKQVRLLLLDHKERERRAIVNATAVTKKLRDRFPDVKIDAVKMSMLDPAKQLQELATTSILVSTVGSASFRMLFLPDDAQVILIGCPAVPVKFDETMVTPAAFKEVDACWGHLGYLSVWRYHVGKDEREYELAEGRPHFLKEGRLSSYEYMRVWDADIIVDQQRLEDLVQIALEQLHRHRA